MNKVFDLLKENHITTLATCADNKPRASVVDYYLAGNAVIFATSPDSIKAHNLKLNKRISMSVNNLPKFVTLDGVVTEPAKAEIDSYNQALFKHHPEFKEMAEKGIAMPVFVYFKLVIETAYYNDYTNGMSPTEIIKA